LVDDRRARLLARLQLVLHGVPEGLVNDPQVWHGNFHPFGRVAQPVAPLALFGFRIATPLPPVPDEAPHVEVIVEDADGLFGSPRTVLAFHWPPLGPGIPAMFNFLAIWIADKPAAKSA